MAKITFLGDWTYCNYSSINATIVHKLDQSDILIYNFESAIDFEQTNKPYKSYTFIANKGTNFYFKKNTVIHLANNHLFDGGVSNAIKTVNFLKKKTDIIGIIGKNIKPYTIKKYNDERIGIIGCSQFVHEKNNCFRFLLLDSDELLEIIDELHKKVDKVILSVHWGLEQNYFPQKKQIHIARSLSDKVDFFFGHHSHVFQPYEKIDDKWIFYSLGNFQIPVTVTKYKLRQSIGSIVEYNTDNKTINLIPIKINNAMPKFFQSTKMKEFYKQFLLNNHFSLKNKILTYNYHYFQNMCSWHKRIKEEGIKEIIKMLKWHKSKFNLIGFLNYICVTILHLNDSIESHLKEIIEDKKNNA